MSEESKIAVPAEEPDTELSAEKPETDAPAEEPKAKASAAEKKKKWFGTFEIIIAVMLAITTLSTAWASWISGLHGSDMSSNYALSARQTAEATTAYNAANQMYISAYQSWDYAFEMYEDINYERAHGDTELADHDQEVLDAVLTANCEGYEYFKDAIYDALAKGNGASPFDVYGEDAFFQQANEMFDKASDTRASADWNNLCSDCFGLVQVLFSIVLFLLGIVGVYREPHARIIIFTVGMVLFVFATIYMWTLPLPVNFDFNNYFTVIQGL